jgi:hypothetical protein
MIRVIVSSRCTQPGAMMAEGGCVRDSLLRPDSHCGLEPVQGDY